MTAGACEIAGFLQMRGVGRGGHGGRPGTQNPRGQGARRWHLPEAKRRRCCWGTGGLTGAEFSPLPAGEARSERCTGSQHTRLKPWHGPARKSRAPPLLSRLKASDQPVLPPCLSPRMPAPSLHLFFPFPLPPDWRQPGGPPGGHQDWQWQNSSREGGERVGVPLSPGEVSKGSFPRALTKEESRSGKLVCPAS